MLNWQLHGSKFKVNPYDVLMVFKAAGIFCPVSVQWLRPTDVSVQSLRAFNFLDSDAIINGLKAELPVYLAATKDVNVLNEEQKVEWWHRQEGLETGVRPASGEVEEGGV